MVQSSKTFMIFVSSTFSDLKEERNILQKHAFPSLRELCAEHGFKFQAIDLRWGVSEEAGLDQQTMKICFEEIERSQKVSPKPNFIVLLGDRYGWRPLAYEFPSVKFEKVLDVVLMDVFKGLLLWKEKQVVDEKGWYCEDLNPMPFVYCFQLSTGKNEKYESLAPVKERLYSILLEAVYKLDLKEEDYLKYYVSATIPEIWKGLESKDAHEHVLGFFREIESLPSKLECEFLEHT